MNKITSDKMRWIMMILSIFVSMTHIVAYYEWEDDLCTSIISFIQYMAIPTMVYFFFASAYFLFRNYEKGQYKEKLIKRVRTLLIPYLIWNVIGYFELIALGQFHFSITGFLRSLVFCYLPGWEALYEPRIGPLWYLVRLMTYVIIAPIIYRIVKKKYIFYPLTMILIVFIWYSKINYYSFVYWFPVYLIGAFVAVNYREWFENMLAVHGNTKDNKKYLTVLAMAVYGLFCWVAWYLKFDNFLVRMAAVFMIFLCLYLVSAFPAPRWITVHTPFFLYCIHIPLRWILQPQIYGKLGDWHARTYGTYMNNLIMYVFMLVATLVCAYGLQWILYKLCPKVESVLLGGR